MPRPVQPRGCKGRSPLHEKTKISPSPPGKSALRARVGISFPFGEGGHKSKLKAGLAGNQANRPSPFSLKTHPTTSRKPNAKKIRRSSMSENNVYELYGSMVFNDEAMRRRLPKEVYKSLTRTIATGKTIDASIADAVANAMKDWAIEKGATHYTHWFQPLTGVTAEKHDAFIAPLGAIRWSWSFPERSSSRANRMPPPSRPAVCALPLRRGAIPRGIRRPMRSSRAIPSISPPPSAPIPARRWIPKRRFCAPWTRCPSRLCASCGCSATPTRRA